MAMKIALIAVLCISQGFALKPFFGKERIQCKHPVAESAEKIPYEFEEAINEMDEVRETVSATIMESHFKGTNPKVIIACFNQQRGNYEKLGQNIANKLREGAQNMAEELGDRYEEFAQRTAEPFRKIAETLKTLPGKMWENIKNQEFTKALEVYRQSRKIVEENARLLAEITAEFAEEFPQLAEKAQKLAQEVREDARRGCQEIGNAFRKCIEEGGPKFVFEEEFQVQPAVEETQ